MKEHYFTCSEIAKITNRNLRTVHRWIRTGKLKATRPGGVQRYLISESDFNAFMSINNNGGAA